ncbi:30S ribosomal protein S13 [Candidatus Woesearchaeota archaeon]|nr:30S ribosomal protein S13 [Candidatus Woesearchaeota archaeon]
MPEEKQEQLKPFLRVLNTDLHGEKPLIQAIRKVHGIGFSMANAICRKLSLDPLQKAGLVDDATVKKIELLIKSKEGLPTWMYNRKGDFETGEDVHLTGSDLKLQQEFDVKRMKKIKTYRGMRHSIGQPVRGQRTRSHFRKGRAVGVQKTKIVAAPKPAKQAKE